jgi:hypothetical protein
VRNVPFWRFGCSNKDGARCAIPEWGATSAAPKYVRAALAVNRELVLFYWSIGWDILDRQEAGGWGAKIIDRLASDLAAEFPGVEGFSTRNLKYIGLSWRLGQTSNLCNRLLQNCQGDPTCASAAVGRIAQDSLEVHPQPHHLQTRFGCCRTQQILHETRRPMQGNSRRSSCQTDKTACVELRPIQVEPAPAAGLESSCNNSKTVGGLYAPL